MVSTYPFFAVCVAGTCTTARTVRRAIQRQSRLCIVCQSTSAVLQSHTRAGGGGRNTRNTYTRALEPALSSVYGTRIIIYMYRRVYIIISGIIHAGNEVFCNTHGGGGDDRRRSYCIQVDIPWYLVYTYADLWALVVPSSLSRLIENTCTCSRRATKTTSTTRKQTATGSFFPTSSSERAASRTARRSIRMCP